MFNNFLLSALSGFLLEEVLSPRKFSWGRDFVQRQEVKIFLSAGFLVSVPVFVQAPLVRLFPWFSLLLTGVWVGLGLLLLKKQQTQVWGDLLLGFSWSWLAGSIYWGWFRHEPLIHLPIEAIGLPLAVWGLSRGSLRVGNLFYLGSLLGTAITDIYFYITNLIPYWREVMQVEPELAGSVLQRALMEISNPWGVAWGLVLVSLLLAGGFFSWQKGRGDWLAFSGAILSTILVDSLFLIAAFVA